MWLGSVQTKERAELLATPLESLALTFTGIPGSVHSGVTSPSCSRVTAQHPRGTEIRNVRQLSIVSTEELDAIARAIGLDAIDPARVGASILLRGIPDFSHVPPSSRLQSAAGTTLVIDMENRPCQFPGVSLEAAHPGHGKGFKSAATGRRGVTAWVEREGRLTLGDRLTLHVPDQPAWKHLAAARAC